MYVDKLNKMLREYYNTINSLKDVEKDLLSDYLEKLKSVLTPGTESYNLNSLGIKHFIDTCTQQIKSFQDIKNKVEEKTRNIEDIVKTIERAEILRKFDFAKIYKNQSKMNDFLTLNQFIAYFENYMSKEVENLADKYMRIGETMLPQITNSIFTNAIFNSSKNGDKKVDKMRLYYYYWERRIYNALVKMVMRALLNFKQLLKVRREKSIPLFKVSTEFNNEKKVVTNPNFAEINNSFQRFLESILETANSFYRWKDGTCICIEPTEDKANEEDMPMHTFYRDINKNAAIKRAFADIISVRSKAMDRLKGKKIIWEVDVENSEQAPSTISKYKAGLFSPKHRSMLDKKLEKN